MLLARPSQHFYAHPLTSGRKAQRCWGLPCQVPFEHEGRRVSHHGLVVLSNPMATALRKTRAQQLRQLRQELNTLRAKIGQPHYRTPKALQRSINARLKASKVGQLMHVELVTTDQGQLDLRWQIDTYQLWQAMQKDGRYLLVTNDPSLSPSQMLSHYRQKDGVERRFRVAKSDLQFSPMYVHLDRRIQGLFVVNLIALLAYSLLERQMRRAGLNLTTRKLIQHLDSLHLIETYYLDGSCAYRLTPLSPQQQALLNQLPQILTDLAAPQSRPLALPQLLALPQPLLSLAQRC